MIDLVSFAPVYRCRYCTVWLDSWLDEIKHLQIMHAEAYLAMRIRWEQENAMDTAGLPLGNGRYTVWGIPAVERDDNRGLTSKQQDATTNEVEIYRTDSEEEARQLVRESGFEHKGRFYATTRISDTVVAQNRENIASASGIHPRQAPLGKDKF